MTGSQQNAVDSDRAGGKPRPYSRKFDRQNP
uniref:Uncharacterized protein n=1 Tax=Arundo donax TaxID=35708 RepID=A0A0A9ECX6_ARUDO